ncbi:TetR/AcrR family transcriptional regulator [Thaumasiovibrio subtropicus]|uniref:TetR/AcrR family transcriptional regulator n=1 Tax=Thaumasiovibrio subtropicus TaxID=1891207 RepID=UPI000B34DEDF|nr:TetR/AcrR family transcriptional regulator [Thaumasiovibrio subtropicus]
MKTRDRITQGALELFNEHGEPNITTNHIAAHLEISPGNLYYHFRNKEQIIDSIFDAYANDLKYSFSPKANYSSEELLTYLDAIFMLMWRYRFFYANLPDILSRDEHLQEKYLQAQEVSHQNIVTLLESFRHTGLLSLGDKEMQGLANTLKLVISCWVAYQTVQAPKARITKSVVYQGVLQVLSIMKPLTTGLGKQRVIELESHYSDQVQQDLV